VEAYEKTHGVRIQIIADIFITVRASNPEFLIKLEAIIGVTDIVDNIDIIYKITSRRR
jgi:hypothetical protein